MATQCFRLVKRDPWTGTRFETGHFRDSSEQVAARFAFENTMLSTREAGPMDWDTIRNGTFSGHFRDGSEQVVLVSPMETQCFRLVKRDKTPVTLLRL